MVLCSTIVTLYGPRSGQQWFYVVPLLPATGLAAGKNGFMYYHCYPLRELQRVTMVLCTEKRVLRANHLIYTPAAYVVTFFGCIVMVLCTEKRVLRANHTIYTPAAYVVTFSRLYSYVQCRLQCHNIRYVSFRFVKSSCIMNIRYKCNCYKRIFMTLQRRTKCWIP
jgi:hypothetical protein